MPFKFDPSEAFPSLPLTPVNCMSIWVRKPSTWWLSPSASVYGIDRFSSYTSFDRNDGDTPSRTSQADHSIVRLTRVLDIGISQKCRLRLRELSERNYWMEAASELTLLPFASNPGSNTQQGKKGDVCNNQQSPRPRAWCWHILRHRW